MSEAISELKELLDAGKLNQFFIRAKDLREALGTYEDYYILCALAHEKNRNIELAIQSLNKIVIKNPINKGVYLKLSNLHTVLKQYKLALAAVDKYIELDDCHFGAYYNKGLVLHRLERFEDAISCYEKSLKLNPDFGSAIFNKALAFEQLGNDQITKELLQNVLDLHPDHVGALIQLGLLAKKKRNYKQSIEHFEEAQKLSPANVRPIHNIALTLEQMGHFEPAIEKYINAINSDPNFENSRECLFALFHEMSNTKSHNNLKPLMMADWLTKNTKASAKIIIIEAIKQYCAGNYEQVKLCLYQYDSLPPDCFHNLDKLDKQFCAAFANFISGLVNECSGRTAANSEMERIFHIGESHCLSFSGSILNFGSVAHFIQPSIIFGVKAFHLANSEQNKFKRLLREKLEYIPERSKVFVSIGEIDCRADEGIIVYARANKLKVNDVVKRTVNGYVKFLNYANRKRNHDIYIVNVPAPLFKKKQSLNLNREVSECVRSFNKILGEVASEHNFFVLDVYSITRGQSGYGDPKYYVDGRHLGKSIIPDIQNFLL